ncbi:hypothetical protein NQ317_016970 [Molorchus minor]|uniref:Transposase n=1 Tax=Molorchus minor TaxID=1323400 RepID=A0ABQ9K6A2_9CUCU|nr:hypothetical protein NQ317_016970 [Molorchus minor]
MNPIENFWGLIVKGIYKRNFRPANAKALWKVIQNAWEELREDQNYSQNLIESMPRRLDALACVSNVNCLLTDVSVSETNKTLNSAKVTKVEDILDSSTVTRYIYIQNIDNPVKIFRETAV